MTKENQNSTIDTSLVVQKLNRGEISIGEAIKMIRTTVYGITQARYANMCKVSEKTLREIEKDKSDPRLSIVTRLLRPGALALSARVLVNKVEVMSDKNRL